MHKTKKKFQTYVPVEKYINPGFNCDDDQVVPVGGRTMMVTSNTDTSLFEVEKIKPNLEMMPTKGESLRDYVPGPGIGDPAKWYGLRICIKFIMRHKIF